MPNLNRRLNIAADVLMILYMVICGSIYFNLFGINVVSLVFAIIGIPAVAFSILIGILLIIKLFD